MRIFHFHLLLGTALALLASAQDAAPKDRNEINSGAKPGGMMADSPITFPVAAQFPADLRARSYPAEKDYFIMDDNRRSLAQIRQILAKMPKGEFAPLTNKREHAKQSLQRLTSGGELHILMLGDSIINDTARSGWITLLRDHYPAAKIRGTIYVRGGGNCGHFQAEERVRKHILPLRPDLVIIGGISQRDIASIQEVIRQIRAGLPDCEFLLTTGVFGTADPRSAEAMAKARHSGTGLYGAELQNLAEAERCAYLDMTTPWVQYIQSSGLHPHAFYRDAVHANEYGEQILAKILLRWWTMPES